MKDKYDLIIEFFDILSDRTRFDIVELLRDDKQRTPAEIIKELKKSQSTISQQLKKLVQSNIIEVHQEGVKKYYKISDPQIYILLTQISDFIHKVLKPTLDIEDYKTLTRVNPEDILWIECS